MKNQYKTSKKKIIKCWIQINSEHEIEEKECPQVKSTVADRNGI